MSFLGHKFILQQKGTTWPPHTVLHLWINCYCLFIFSFRRVLICIFFSVCALKNFCCNRSYDHIPRPCKDKRDMTAAEAGVVGRAPQFPCWRHDTPPWRHARASASPFKTRSQLPLHRTALLPPYTIIAEVAGTEVSVEVISLGVLSTALYAKGHEVKWQK